MSYWVTIIFLVLAGMSLGFRVLALRSISTDELVKVLNIDIPKASKICIDNITESKVYIHWEIPNHKENTPNFASKMVYYMVFMNDKQLLTLNPNEHNVCLSKLIPDTCYKLDLVSVNVDGYKSKSESVHIRTKSMKIQQFQNKWILENPESLFKILTFNQGDVSSIHKLSSPLTQIAADIMANNKDETAPNANGTANSTLDVSAPRATGRTRSNTVNSEMNRSTLHTAVSTTYTPLQDPRDNENIEDLRWHLEHGQELLRAILAEQDQAYREYKETEALLVKERDSLRERVKLGVNNKKALLSETKMLEDSRRLIELKKKKMITNLEKRKKNIAQKKNELANWNKTLDEFDTETQKLNESEERIHADLDSNITVMEEKVGKLHSLLSEVEEEYKRINPKRRHCESLKPALIKTLKALNLNMDKSGCLNLEGIQALEMLKKDDEDIYNRLKVVVEQDSRLEAEWRSQQQREVNNCINVSKAFDVVKNENHQIKQAIQSQALQRQSSATTAHSFNLANNQAPPLPNTGVTGFTYPPSSLSQQKRQAIPHVSYNYDLSGSNPSLNSFTQQAPSQQSISQLPSSPWPSYRNTGSSFMNHNSNNLSLRIPSLTNDKPNGFDYLNDYDALDTPSAAQSFLPTNLIGDEANSDRFFNAHSNGSDMFAASAASAALPQQVAQSSVLIQPNSVDPNGASLLNNNSDSNLGNTSLNFHYNTNPQMNHDFSSGNSRSLFLGGHHSSSFSFDNNSNNSPRLLSNHEPSLNIPNSPPHSNEFLSAHNSPNQAARSHDLNSLLPMDTTTHPHLHQLSQLQQGQSNNFGNTIDSFVTANSVVPSNESPFNAGASAGGTSAPRDTHSGSSIQRRFSSLFSLGFGLKKNNIADESHESINDHRAPVSPQKHQHSKFFKPPTELTTGKPSSGSSTGTSKSSHIFPFMNNDNVEQLDLWTVQSSNDFDNSWSVPSQISTTPVPVPAAAQVPVSNNHLSVSGSPSLSDSIKKVPTNSQRSVASSQAIEEDDEDDELFPEIGGEIGVPTHQTITNKSFTNSIKSRGSHSGEGSSSASFLKSRLLGFGDQTKSPNKTQQPSARIDDSDPDLEEYNRGTTPRKSSMFSSSSHSSKKKSRKQSSSSIEDATPNNNPPSSTGSEQSSSSLKGLRRLSLFNGRSNSHAKEDE